MKVFLLEGRRNCLEMAIENKMDTPLPLQIQSYGGFGRKRKPSPKKAIKKDILRGELHFNYR